MSMSLRDQLLQAGLVSQKQVKDAERQQERARHVQKPKRGAPAPPVAARPSHAAESAQAAKLARDQALNRQQQEKQQRKALLAQIKQLIEQNRLPVAEGADFFNFVDDNKIRRIAATAALRESLGRGDLAIVRYAGGYEFVPAAIAARIRERDEHAVITLSAPDSAPTDAAYEQFAVPDDLMW